ncbi:CPBP family intramembrane glutamic endopeptidase [uncultured Clostridium sp.]|uniref:CPBP family intramembrane glutamic endopeptidase n=1 Tax=uncultured Clostridium sp. TaxID=59620 RepID=UPI0025E81409|nr:CPBP family intramembrane glutamic endopeptidase [uncultured Clostridium sp.]MDU4884732.1 CPBP family intramembrane glutamic endopeptidase [Clostridium celatum]MDU7078223.1 CPBP family intramembrane glutamic endopeptidase [Clostridium celatum]
MKNILNKCDNELNVSKVDGVLAIFMIGYVFFSTAIDRYIVFDLVLWDKFASYFNNRLFARFLFHIPLSLFQILPIFIILKYRKQSLKSIGFNKVKILKQISIGIILYIPLYLLLLILNWVQGINFNLDSMSIWNFLYMLIEIALVEEIIFRGFLQQRLKGLIKNKYVNLLVVAFVFGSIHIPFILAQSNLTFFQVFISVIPKMIMHIYFVGIYKAGNNSVLSATIAHGVNNFIATL